MPITIRDVARGAGVGLGTVSRVLNDSPLVSEATRQRVLQVIAELNFVPNQTARRLSRGTTQSIAVLIPFFTNPAAVERLRGVDSTLSQSTYDLIIYNVETLERRDTCLRDVPRREKADGVLIISLPPPNEYRDRLAHSEVPIVLVDVNDPSLTGLPRVVVDDVAGGRIATQHLIDLGHRRIGYISELTINSFHLTSARDRYRGYRQALAEAGIPFQPAYRAQGLFGRFEARRLATEMLSAREPPTAIFAASDTQALGVLDAAEDSNLRVPEDLSVVGYDDLEAAEHRGLTTVRQHLYESGKRGVELLLEVMQDRSYQSVCEVLPSELIVRRTTAPRT